MKDPTILPQAALYVAAVFQTLIACLSLRLVYMMKWKPHLEKVPLLIREVFHVHTWFISFTLFIFAALTFRFADEMAGGENIALRWLTVAIGLFWGTRAVLQVTYYSRCHWQGNTRRTVAHVTLLVIYGGMAVLYLILPAIAMSG